MAVENSITEKRSLRHSHFLEHRRHFPDERGNSNPVHSQKKKAVANVRFQQWRLLRMPDRHVVSYAFYESKTATRPLRVRRRGDSVLQVHEMSTVISVA
jgi:hypothetical protein